MWFVSRSRYVCTRFSGLFYPANFLKSTSRPQRRGVWLITLPKTCRLNVMARGVLSPAATVPLPKVSFVKVQDDVSTKPAGVHDGQARSYGCLCRLIQFWVQDESYSTCRQWFLGFWETWALYSTYWFATSSRLTELLWRAHLYYRTTREWTRSSSGIWHGWTRFDHTVILSAFYFHC